MSTHTEIHTPTLTAELLSLLALRSGDLAIDATIDGGGHAQAMLQILAPNGRILGIDRDAELLNYARGRFREQISRGQLVLVHGSFADIGAIAKDHGFTHVRAVVFDLGVSSFHFDYAKRGFSFRSNEPLDMRFDTADASLPTAADMIASLDAQALARIFAQYGEERYAWRIARAIVARRPVRTTRELYACIEEGLPARVRWQAARSAARVFQALRIAVNNELQALEQALPQTIDLLAVGGKLAVVSFHSLEDRIVKRFLRKQHQLGTFRIVTKKPVRPTAAEVQGNPRAASAKLRVGERIV